MGILWGVSGQESGVAPSQGSAPMGILWGVSSRESSVAPSLGKIANTIAWDQTNCVMVAPGRPEYWVSMLKDLPTTGTVPTIPDRIVHEEATSSECVTHYSSGALEPPEAQLPCTGR